MASRGDRMKQLNETDTANVQFCEMLTSTYKLEDFFPNDPYLVAVFKNYRSRKLNELTLFWCFLVSFMHWSSETKLFDKSVSDYINLNLYGILRGNSVSHKSGYIKAIRQGFDFVEKYLHTPSTDPNEKRTTTCVESLTPAKLLVELETSSKFISSDEDRPLTDFGFFEPFTPKAKEAQPYLTTAFNGAYKVQRSTMTYSKNIQDKSLTMLIPTTGNQWPLLLEYFSDSCQTNGIYERILYWIIGKKNFVQEEVSLNEELPSLEYLFITRQLIGNRTYQYDDDALNYLRPIIHKMRNNGPSCDGLFDIPKNKRAESCERRGADLIERISAIIQNLFDTLKVLEPIKSINFNCIKKSTLNDIKINIGSYFYSNELFSQARSNTSYPDDIDLKELPEVQIFTVNKAPLQTMKVGLAAAKIAVNLYHKLLLPQAIQLFSVDFMYDKKQMLNELKILEFPINCFSISDLTCGDGSIFHNYKRDNIDVKQLLSNLQKKNLLKYGKFIKSTFRTVESWIKMLPDPTNIDDITRFHKELHTDYQLDFEKYIDLYQDGVCNKSSLTETAQDILFRQRSWISKLQHKIHSTTNQNKHPDVIQQDLIEFVTQTTEPIDRVPNINVPSPINDFVDSAMDNNPMLCTNDDFLSNSIEGCLQYIIEQAIDLADTNDVLNVNPTTFEKNTVSPHAISTTCLTSTGDALITDEMKSLCKKILLTDSIVLSSTKLNKTCKTNMVDVHKACHLLIANGLLTKENKILANKSSYYECYLKQIPCDKSKLVDFSFTLAKFGIADINLYYDTLKTIDTKNTTYLSPNGLSIFEQKPYSDIKIIINNDAIIQPLKERCHKLADDCDVTLNKGNGTQESIDFPTNVEENLQDSRSNLKRRRELTGRAKEYKDEQEKKKKH